MICHFAWFGCARQQALLCHYFFFLLYVSQETVVVVISSLSSVKQTSLVRPSIFGQPSCLIPQSRLTLRDQNYSDMRDPNYCGAVKGRQDTGRRGDDTTELGYEMTSALLQ